jgi:two-component system, LytTR family, sensor kinase
MKKSVKILLHIGFWVCYLILITIMLTVYYRSIITSTNQEFRILNALKSLFLFAFLPSITSYWLYYFRLFPKYLQHKNIFLSIIHGLFISIGAATIAYILIRYSIESGYMIDMDRGGKHGRTTAVIAIAAMTVIGVVSGIVALIIKGFINWVDEKKLKEALKEKNHQMEMALIKAKLDPHLLFNTINNIDALIIKDAVEASNYLNKLSDIIRFMLYETMAEKILLSQEIEYIEKYIALQKIRTANANYVQFSVTGNVGQTMIAPMVFIPFIENAFKHTNNKKIENAIAIHIIVSNKTIQLVCENKIDSNPSVRTPGSGLGNELIQKRLELIYPEKHTLEVNKTGELYTVNLTINNG